MQFLVSMLGVDRSIPILGATQDDNGSDKAESTNTLFLARLPATYNEWSRVIRQAVAADDWIDIGLVAEHPSRHQDPTAQYRAYESSVE
ncbi:MAG: hypothetical protein GY771_10905 [bacterium]|nr:hypothetical protein [bacterium]